MNHNPAGTPEEVALAKAGRALKLVAANLPHLSGLVHAVRLRASWRYPVAAVGPSGLVLINPRAFADAPLGDLVFVLAHELLHLALDTFGRAGNADPYLVNVAHDYIINDILVTELRRPIPLGGLEREGARRESLEALVAQMNAEGIRPPACWRFGLRPARRPRDIPPQKSSIQEQLEKLGLVPPEAEGEKEEEPETYPPGDALTAEEEAALEPGVRPVQRQQQRERVRREAVRAVSLHRLRRQMEEAVGGSGMGSDTDASEAFLEAIRTAYQPPWQLALQHWLDPVAPGPRSFARPSRRSGERDDVVLPGRKREGWTLHIVLDTSGSMTYTLPHILGLIASFCEGAGVSDIHILQCDVGVTADEWIDVAELERYRIAGFGGSNMSPAMRRLAVDSEVGAVLVLTDGYIAYPPEEPPYSVLWGVVQGSQSFRPPYGTVVHVRL